MRGEDGGKGRGLVHVVWVSVPRFRVDVGIAWVVNQVKFTKCGNGWVASTDKNFITKFGAFGNEFTEWEKFSKKEGNKK